jgi:hypothetical protein
MDLRPTLDVVNLDAPRRVYTERKKRMKAALTTLSKEDKKRLTHVMSRYRRKQKKLWGRSVSDPDPYDSHYVFFCLEGKREK